jgi:hypothetical protein
LARVARRHSALRPSAKSPRGRAGELRRRRRGDGRAGIREDLCAQRRSPRRARDCRARRELSTPTELVTFTAAVVVFGGDLEDGYGAVQFLGGERTARPDKLGRAS